ncbi:recombinase RecT, partial [Providencia stuartii]
SMAGLLAKKLELAIDEKDLIQTLKSTAFKAEATEQQFLALLIVANQYNLNPWTKEIYAFPDRTGIVPVVGVDGWARIINENKNFDGMEFIMDADSC